MEGCIFCMIVAGEIPSKRVYEDEYVIAFDDITPQAPVHTLVVPREHHETLGDDVSPELMSQICSTVVRVAEMKGIDRSGYRVVVNNGPDAGQTVGHLHVHVMGGAKMSHEMAGSAGD